MLENKIWKTMVLVIDYPLLKEKELEKILKPLAPKINTFGEVWEPYNGLKSDVVYAVLDNLESVRTTQNIKAELLALIADWSHYGDDDPACDVMLSRGYKNSAEEIKKIVEKM